MEDIISEKEAAAEEIAAAKRKPTDRESETPEGIMAEEGILLQFYPGVSNLTPASGGGAFF